MKISDDCQSSVAEVEIETSIVEIENKDMNTLYVFMMLKSFNIFISSWIESFEMFGLNFRNCFSNHFYTERPISSLLLSSYFNFLKYFLMWDLTQLMKISTGENSGE